MTKRHMELLAPAGNMDKLKMAIRYGADAVQAVLLDCVPLALTLIMIN